MFSDRFRLCIYFQVLMLVCAQNSKIQTTRVLDAYYKPMIFGSMKFDPISQNFLIVPKSKISPGSGSITPNTD